MDSEYVVQLYSVLVQDKYIYILMEFCNGGSLSQYLQARGGWLCEAEARFLVIQISKGMAAISRQNIVHRDLKPDNILI